jgi:hypothetical protein
MEEKELVSQKLQYASIIVSMASGLISIVWVSTKQVSFSDCGENLNVKLFKQVFTILTQKHRNKRINATF